jgi:hypothetical protein
MANDQIFDEFKRVGNINKTPLFEMCMETRDAGAGACPEPRRTVLQRQGKLSLWLPKNQALERDQPEAESSFGLGARGSGLITPNQISSLVQ